MDEIVGMYDLIETLRKISDHLRESKSEDMTLRDRFAMETVKAILGNKEMYTAIMQTAKSMGKEGFQGDILAENAYDMADSMLRARSKENTNDDK